MAKQNTQPKMRWYQTLWQAYKFTAASDKPLPWILGAIVLVPLGAAVTYAVLTPGIASKIIAPLLGLSTGLVAGLWVLTRRFERTMYRRMEGTLGGSISVAQAIRRGWQFAEQPVAIDQKGQAVVFQGVGVGGIILLAEGGNAARKPVEQTTQRLHKLAPGVPVTPIYVGKGEGLVPLGEVGKAVRRVRRQHFGFWVWRGLSPADQATVRARLKALGGMHLPVPKGIDPTRARADRKALRGR